ncbi:hypothetical protein DPEC_G00196970 [Dallia pectoralis]|uniref:Uncharacterized protein n=1 Tax=Dallia pectoralis TaxID=75939 RepID=A0ACC2G825_DALPE|nr:hypothetical protein DPEC_G00196970 [Dallia pectoralis]
MKRSLLGQGSGSAKWPNTSWTVEARFLEFCQKHSLYGKTIICFHWKWGSCYSGSHLQRERSSSQSALMEVGEQQFRLCEWQAITLPREPTEGLPSLRSTVPHPPLAGTALPPAVDGCLLHPIQRCRKTAAS